MKHGTEPGYACHMRAESLAFFQEIVNTASPSGYEEAAAEVYRSYCKPFADEVKTDIHGNTWAALNPDAETRIMLAGHMDEIGFIVHYISDEGTGPISRRSGAKTPPSSRVNAFGFMDAPKWRA